MSMKRTYDTVNGQILAETASGVTKNYVVDALGSVIGVSQAEAARGRCRLQWANAYGCKKIPLTISFGESK